MEIIGKLLLKLPTQSGVGRNGNTWQKGEFVIETIEEQYPKKVCATLWGDKLDMLNAVNIGDTVKVSFSVESREYNGKWYTDVRAWKIEAATEGSVPPITTGVNTVTEPVTSIAQPPYSGGDTDTFTDNGVGDDLPF